MPFIVLPVGSVGDVGIRMIMMLSLWCNSINFLFNSGVGCDMICT